MYQLVLIIHVIMCVCLIGLVLVQHGKGADMGAAFGSGASATVFGSQGAGSFLFKLTAFFATMFFVTSIFLAHMLTHDSRQQQHPLLNMVPTAAKQVPAAPTAADEIAAQTTVPTEKN